MAEKKKKIKVTPDKPYYSSKSLEEGFEETLPGAVVSEEYKKHSPLGEHSLRAGIIDSVHDLLNIFRSSEGETGSRHAGKAAQQMVEKEQSYNEGGIVKPLGVGQATHGWGKAMRSKR